MTTTGREPGLDHFREVLGQFLTGVVVVTAFDGDEPVGMTVQSLVSLSLDPPLVLICPSRTSTTWPRIERASRFCLNILAVDQRRIGAAFATRGTDRFAGIAWRKSELGPPLIADALAYVFAEIERREDGGDHHIIIGRVLESMLGRRDDPLPYFRGSFALSGSSA